MVEIPMSQVSAGRDTKHGRLRLFLAEQIGSGEYGEGQFLPSEPSLARQFDISRSTVRQALAELESDGLVERIAGKGTLVCINVEQSKPFTQPQQTSLTAFALVLPEIRTGYYPALVHCFDEAAGGLHHQILVCTTGNDIHKQGDIVLQLIDKKVAGVALLPPTVGSSPAHQIRQLQNHKIPVVLLHRGVEGISAPVIAIPYEKIADMAARALVKQGHRRIALFLSHRSASGQRYERGFAAALADCGCELRSELVHCGTNVPRSTSAPDAERQAEVETALKQMLALPADRRPTAAFDPWDADAEAIYLALAHQGVKIPEEFSVVSFGGAGRSGTLSRRITAVTVAEQEFARHAADLLDQMCRGEEPIESARQYEVRLDFYSGATLLAAQHHS